IIAVYTVLQVHLFHLEFDLPGLLACKIGSRYTDRSSQSSSSAIERAWSSYSVSAINLSERHSIVPVLLDPSGVRSRIDYIAVYQRISCNRTGSPVDIVVATVGYSHSR